MTTKIHLVADSQCRPIARVTTAGQRHDSVAFTPVMADISITRSCGGTPRTRPDRVLADKAYSTRKIRDALRRRGIKATIPEPSNQVAGRKSRGWRTQPQLEPDPVGHRRLPHGPRGQSTRMCHRHYGHRPLAWAAPAPAPAASHPERMRSQSPATRHSERTCRIERRTACR